MASLPLFPMPSGLASFVPSRPAIVRPLARPGVLPASRPIESPSPPVARPEPAGVAPSGVAPSGVERTEAAMRDAGLAGRVWRGDALSVSPLPSTPSGFRALDEQLPGGGWPARCLTELLLAHPGVGEIRFLAATLSSLTQAGRQIVLLAPPHIPDPTGWEQLGIDMRHVLVVRTERPADRLWALEESLRSSAFGALVAWLPEDKTLARHDVLRRLQSAAATANGLTFLMRPTEAQYHASPAPLRMTLAAGRPEGQRRTLSVRLLKRRGPVLASRLTLLLPEIHRGMKAMRPMASRPVDTTVSDSKLHSKPGAPSRSFPTAASPIARATSASMNRRAPVDLFSSHALAGSLLSDTAA